MKQVKYKVLMKWVEKEHQWYMLYKRQPNDFVMHYKHDANMRLFFGSLNKKKVYEYQVVVKEWSKKDKDGLAVTVKFVAPANWYMLHKETEDFICMYPDCKNVKLFFRIHRREDRKMWHDRIIKLTRIGVQ